MLARDSFELKKRCQFLFATKIASVALFIVCRRRTFRLLWRSVCSNGNFCTQNTDRFLCTCCIGESSSSVAFHWWLLLLTRSRRRKRARQFRGVQFFSWFWDYDSWCSG